MSLALATPVEIRSDFDGAWLGGFEVVESAANGYRVRRRSDRFVLPKLFPASLVRRARAPFGPRRRLLV